MCCHTLTQQEPKIDHAKTVVGPVNAMQAVKLGAKETSRQQVLASKPWLSDITPTNWMVVNMLVKAKQAARRVWAACTVSMLFWRCSPWH
jgi:hypothetical protein